MPQFKVQAPDGKVITVEGPEGGTEDQAIAFAQKQYAPTRTWGGALKEGITNIPESAVEFGKSTVQPFLHPLDTVGSMADLAAGVMQKLGLVSGQEGIPGVDAVGRFLADRYGGAEQIKKTLATDPVGMAADISLILTGGGSLAERGPGIVGEVGRAASAAGRASDPLVGAGKVAKGAGYAASEGLGLLTGTSGETMREIGQSGFEGGAAARAYTEHARGLAPSRDIVDDGRRAVAQLRKERGDDYRAAMAAGVNTDRTILSWNDVDRALIDMDKVGNFRGMSGRGPTQVINQSAKGVRDEIGAAIADWKNLRASEYWTPLGFDALKRQVGDIADRLGATEYGSPAHKVAMEAYQAIKETIVKQAPTYARIMQGYEEASDLIREMERTLSLSPTATIDTSMRKLQSVLRNNVNTNYGRRAELVQFLQRAGAPHLLKKIAGQSTSGWFPHGIGRAIGSAEAFGALASGHPAALAVLPASSPRLMGEAAHYAGRGARGFGELNDRVPLRAIGQGAFQAGRATDYLDNPGQEGLQ
jgi:hypothetical protein